MATSGRGASGLASAPSRTPTPRTRIYYNPELSRFSLGDDHPMVPHRLHLTHRLVELWGLLDDPAVTLVSDYSPVTTEELRRFHTAEYVAFLEYLDSLDLERLSVEEQQKLLGEDLAMFGLSVCRLSTGGAAAGEGMALGGADGTSADNNKAWAAPQPSHLQPGVKEQGGLAAQAGAGNSVDGQVPGESSVNPAVLNLAVLLLQRLVPNCNGQLTVAQRMRLVEILRSKQPLLRDAPSAGQSVLGFSLLQALAHAAEQSIAVPEEDQPAQPGGGGGAGAQPGPAARKRPASAQGGGGGKAGKGSGGQRRPPRSRRRLSLSSSEEEDDGDVLSEEEPAEEEVQVAAVVPEAGGRPLRSRGRGGANPTLAAIIAAEAADVEASESEEEDEGEEEDSDDEGGDCPIFPGLLKYVGLQAAGSLLAAKDLAAGLCDIAVHWGGGMHHGMPYRAFGFCYVNDLVLAVLELMAGCGRVLYIDIDIHHGDGVETAFQRTDKVLSISLHKWDDGKLQASLDTLEVGSPRRAVFFPGTGKKNDLGEGRGKYFTINVPLQDNITDESYLAVYEPVIRTAFERFKPQAVVLQCGCDSVAGDKLGRFNLSIRGHSKCVQVVSDLCYEGFGGGGRAPAGGDPARPDRRPVPLLVTGGGGYTPPLVARCWALETAVLLGRELGEVMPRAAAEAPDLRDLGPPYFRDGSELARPPSAPYAMCLDTTWRPSSHKQMDSEYSLSRLTTYLTSNLQRIRLSTDGPDGEAKGGGGGGVATASDGDREGGAAGPGAGAGAGAGAGGVRGKAAEGGGTAAGVDNPEQFLTDPEQYPDALDYIQDQQERVAESAPWAILMPKEAVAAALEAVGGARTAVGSPPPEDKKKEQKGKKDTASGKQPARGGSAAAEDAKAKAAAASGKGKKSGAGAKEASKPPQPQRQQKKEQAKGSGAAAAVPAAAAAFLAGITPANPHMLALLRAAAARAPQTLQIMLGNEHLRNQLMAALRARPAGPAVGAAAAVGAVGAAGPGAAAAAPAAMPGLPMIQPYQPGSSSAAAAVGAVPDKPSPSAAEQEPAVPAHTVEGNGQADGVSPGQ